VAGKSDRLSWIRGGKAQFDRHNITTALEASLKRLQTDYLDLYQLHWPDRRTNFFGALNYQHQPDDTFTPLQEVLAVLNDLVKAGKIRHFGISNETPWGLSTVLKLSECHQLPRVASIQNPYSLLNRTFEIGLAEMAIREQCGLLAYSPLAFGMLTGKHFVGDAQTLQFQPKSRLHDYPDYYSRYAHPQAVEACRAYVRLAKAHGLSPSQMALAFINQQPFVTSNIIGATTLAQLAENIESILLQLSPEVLNEIEAIHTQYPNPAP
jgi:aryl-alcohol dehydrogenase-like predicted oxidoreductase